VNSVLLINFAAMDFISKEIKINTSKDHRILKNVSGKCDCSFLKYKFLVMVMNERWLVCS